MPQLILNYKTGSAEGISLAFLTVWLIGDLANLSGMQNLHRLSPEPPLTLSYNRPCQLVLPYVAYPFVFPFVGHVLN